MMTREQAVRLEAALAKYNEKAAEKINWWDIQNKLGLECFSKQGTAEVAIAMVELMGGAKE